MQPSIAPETPSPPVRPAVVLLTAAAAEGVIAAALGAARAGTIGDLLRIRPRASRWLVRRYLRVAMGTLGTRANGACTPADALPSFLR
jgi:hypothetical protein